MPLKEAYTFFMMPFRLNDGRWQAPGDDSIWMPAEIRIERDILYAHIQQWLQATANAECRQLQSQHATQSFDIYTIRGSHPDEALKHRLATWKKFAAKRWQQQRTGIGFQLVQKESELLSVKLLVNRHLRIGLLLITMQISSGDLCSEKLIDFNYWMHKTDSQAPLCTLADPAQAANEHQQAEQQAMAALMGARLDETTGCQWTLPQAIDFLMADFRGAYEKFNTIRLHTFTYYRMPIECDGPQCREDFLRIVRCENSNYTLPPDDVARSGQLMQTFSNIYLGSSVEGGAIMTLSTPEDDDPKSKGSKHIRNFAMSTLAKRYLWIYILVLMQRHILLRMTAELTQIDVNSQQDASLDKLHRLVERLATLKAHTYFTDISDYTQHNLYYRFCVRNMAIREHFQEISEKMELLRMVIQTRKDEDDSRKNDRLTVILAILTVTSASFDGISLLTLDQYNPVSGLITALALTALIFYVWTKSNKQ